ncbi:hypothetical protein Tco_1188215, partial [Tanacetum coccineum]
MIQVKEMMQDNDLKNSKSKDKGSRSRSQSMNEQSHYKQDKTKTRQSINVKSHIFNVIGSTEEFEERDLNIGGDWDEDLSSIHKMESDEVIKSSVEDLVPIQSLSDEDVPEDNVKIYSNPLFEFDDEYISSDVNPLFNKVLMDIESEESYVSKLDEPDLLVTPLSKPN